MKAFTKALVGFTAAAAVSGGATYPAIANASAFRSYTGQQCVSGTIGPEFSYGLNGLVTQVTTYCPLINDSTLQLDVSTPPTLHVNGNFSINSIVSGSEYQIQACAVSYYGAGSGYYCGNAATITSSGIQSVLVPNAIWAPRATDDGYYVLLNPIESAQATIFSYTTP